MAKQRNAPMTAAELQPTWEYLVKTERRLKRNKPLCRIIQPVGTLIFLFNMLLVTVNLALFFGGETVQTEVSKLPLLSALVRSLPRGGGVIVFSFLFAYLPPLAVCGAISGVFYVLCRRREKPIPPLRGSEANCAKMLAYQAEKVYEMRKEIRFWQEFAATGVLTALMALPIVSVCLRLAEGPSPAVLEIALCCLALLCLFVLFWVYALLFHLFSLLNSLFFLSPGKWTLYTIYQRADMYWESVDPEEFARRERMEQRRLEEKAPRRRRKKPAELPEEEYVE